MCVLYVIFLKECCRSLATRRIGAVSVKFKSTYFLSIMELSPVRSTEVKVAYKFSSSLSMPVVLVGT